MIKAIIFDITGVLFPYQPWAGERPKREELLEIKKLVTDIYDKEKMSKEYLKEKILSFNRPREELDAIYNSLAVIDENLYELIKKLSEKYTLYAMANEQAKWTDIRKDIFGFEKYFKKLYISVELGMKKPEESIYKLLLSDTGLEPEECLFIDDKEVNVEAAQKLGFKGHVYQNFESLKRYLIESKLLPIVI